nr:membrane frizzled-related protein-like [Biomphalaria glabrata]
MYPSTYYLNDNCGKTVLVNGDAIIKIYTNSYVYGSCTVNIRSLNGANLVASFYSYYMYSYYDRNPCQDEYIQLGTPNNPNILGGNYYCHSYKPLGQYALQNVAMFTYFTSSSLNVAPSIQLLVSEVYAKNTTGYCQYGRFDCMSQGACIDESLTCNGYNDCSNGRDEYEGCGFTFTVGAIGGLAAGVFFFFVFVVILSVVCYRRRRVRIGYVQYN